MEASSDTEQKLSAFISQLLSGVVESVHQQGYQVAFLASKCGDNGNDILSLHSGLSLNIQKQLEVNFKSLIEEASHGGDCSIIQSPEETVPSNHPVSIRITDDLAAASSHDDQTSNTRTGMESAAHVDTIKVECTSEFDGSLPEYSPTDDTEYSQTTDDDADEPVEYKDGEKLDASQNQELRIKPEAPMDLEIEHDPTQTSTPVQDPIFERLGGKGKLIYHLRKDTGEKRYVCTECPYGTPRLSNLRSHMMTHGEKPYACTKCPYRGTRISSLKRHILTHTSEKPFACPECPYRSGYEHAMKKHILTHTGDKPFACPECPYRAAQRSNLSNHMQTHTGEKPFACPECPYRTKYKNVLRTHIMTHTGEKPFACPECPYRTAFQATLKTHIMTHTGEKPFACPECPYRTAFQATLKTHIMTHTGEKPFACPECPYRTTGHTALKSHMLKHAREKF